MGKWTHLESQRQKGTIARPVPEVWRQMDLMKRNNSECNEQL
jgi:hypothetical protein